MAQRTVIAEVRALRRAERHVLWLRKNLSKHSITKGVERELLVRRTALVETHGVDVLMKQLQT